MNKEKKNPNKCPICGRPTHKKSKYCIFHASVEEKTEKEFKKSLKEYVNKIKNEDSNYDFYGFIFIGNIIFKEDLKITIIKNADFCEATFQRYVDFGDIIFKGKTDFWKATFQRYVNFRKATFKGKTDFWKATFQRYVDFTQATFQGDALFLEATFEGNTYFMGVTFRGNTVFWKAIFKGNTYFTEATFQGDALFLEATFQGDADFRLKYFVKGLILTKIRLLSGKKLNLKARNNIEIISLERAYLENTYLDIELVKGTLIDFTGALLRNTKIERDQIENYILQEKKNEFSKAKEIYLLLKNNFHSIGRYEDESWAFIKEKDMDRFSKSFSEFVNSHRKKSQFNKILLNIKNSSTKRMIVNLRLFKKWLFSKKAIKRFNLSLSNYIFQYGENPWYVIRFASIVIFIFALLLNISGIVKGDRTDLILQQIKEIQGGSVLEYSGPIIGNFLNCLYFSVVTFTTLGYGDFQPLEGWSRFLVSSEALLGAFTMALFVYTFARRTGGR